jgi:uncharacterized protein YgiM (DUF1202 family)
VSTHQTCRVTIAYQTPYPDPITIRTGEVLLVEDRESEWAGWIWCTNQDGKSAWVPEKYVERKGDRGTALLDYSARELSVAVGEELVMSQLEESGWVWCTNQQGESGWVPLDNIERIS